MLTFFVCFVDLGSGGESVKKLETKIFVGNTDLNKARTELHTVSMILFIYIYIYIYIYIRTHTTPVL